MKVKVDVDVFVRAVFHSLEIEVPDDVVAQGNEAVEQWIVNNPAKVNGAQPAWTESLDVREVTGVINFFDTK